MVPRLCQPLLSRSFFLFGARGTGKTTLLRSIFGDRRDVFWIDLLDPLQEDAYALDPGRLERLQGHEWIVIDEVQKLPVLLDQVHRLIESRGIKFALTGSSARKLKAGQADMLAGRAFLNELHPLTALEQGDRFSLDEAMHWGTLPGLLSMHSDLERQEYLRSYTQVYLKEEVWSEHLVRRLDSFRKFLPVAAQSNGQIVVASKIARDVGCDPKTVLNYYAILEDTLLGFLLEPYDTSIRKAVSGKPKFYFFDLGVQRALARLLQTPLTPATSLYGETFEHFVILEVMRLNAYLRKDFRFYYLRTKDDVEIDLIVDRPGQPLALLEIKSTDRIRPDKLRRFLAISRDFPNAEAFCWSQDPATQKIDHVIARPWREGLERLFDQAEGETSAQHP
ncbi:MAG: ATP-binding protein [Armatimonadetes bacterium]|nr:ATP-binding protein [Armatimonadota bacterium]